VKKFDTTLYLVTDSTGLAETDFLEKVEQALQGGVTFLQLREKERSTREYIHLAQQVRAVARRYQVPLVVDDRVDVALAADADGVHVGQSDMPVRQARNILGPDKIVGATAKTVSQALEAFEQGADYLGVGAIYPTTTKVITVMTSTDTLKEICKAVPIPVNAIGGLNRDNIGVLKGIPIRGICVVSAIMKAADPKAAAEGLRQAFNKLKN
jgi:thiamine-phosphate pyrophosphorylase